MTFINILAQKNPAESAELTKTKADLYTELADDLAEFWHRDAALLERNPEAWEQGRIILEWLETYKEHPKVGLEQFKRNCDRLLAIYHIGPRIKKEPNKKESAA